MWGEEAPELGVERRLPLRSGDYSMIILQSRKRKLLEVRGRKTGEMRSVMLMHVPRGDDLIVIGSGGGSTSTPNWYRNLMAANGGTVQVGPDRWAVTARELGNGPERDECWRLAAKVYPGFDAYQALVDRIELGECVSTSEAPWPGVDDRSRSWLPRLIGESWPAMYRRRPSISCMME